MLPSTAFATADGDESDPPAPGNEWPEEQLWQRLRDHGDVAAREVLICRYRPFARIVAATYYGRRMDDDIAFDDYHQCALVAMIESVDRFDSQRGVQFKTFASRRMHGAILDGIESATEKQRQIAMRRRLREERVAVALKAAQDVRDKPSDSVDDIFRVLAEVGIGLALGLMLEDSGMIAPAPDAVAPDQAYAHAEQRQLTMSVQRAVKMLTEQEQVVIRCHYLEHQLFGDIAAKLGLSKGRVSQVHRQALEKLRHLLGDGNALDILL
jgi:RNA polymerase sigma factor for flagellar operon FliA